MNSKLILVFAFFIIVLMIPLLEASYAKGSACASLCASQGHYNCGLITAQTCCSASSYCTALPNHLNGTLSMDLCIKIINNNDC